MKKMHWSWSLLGLAMAVLLTASPAMALTLDSVGVLWSNPAGPAFPTWTWNLGNEIRWGDPVLPSTAPAGLRFTPSFPPSSLPFGTFQLGILSHINEQISSYIGGLTSVDLTLSPHFSNLQTTDWKYRVHIFETPNHPVPQPDTITLEALDALPLIFTDNGDEYRFTPLGIIPESLTSPEFNTNPTPFWVATVPNPSPLLLIGLGLVALAGATRLSAHRK